MEYIEGGSDREIALARNLSAFNDVHLVQRVLRQVGQVDLGYNLLGRRAKLPLAIAPTGFNGLACRDGDLALARAAAVAGIPFAQSTVSNAMLEDVARIPGLRHWMQIYVFRDMQQVEALIRRAEVAGSEALMVTVDTSVFGNRTWDRRSYRVGTDLNLARKLEALRHPGWLRDWVLGATPGFVNLKDVIPGGQIDVTTAGQWLRGNLEPDLDWDKLKWIQRLWPRKLILKGLMATEDVIQARSAGVDAVVLSNHGGRQLDTAIAPVDILPEVRAAVGPMPLLVDGGIRSGSDIAKAMSLSADGVLLGRATLYGLAAYGAPGVARAIEILAEELRRTMGLTGSVTVDELRKAALKSPIMPSQDGS